MKVIQQHLGSYGRPMAYYSDKHSIFRTTREQCIDGRFTDTQLERALRELRIELICAHFSSADGYSESVNSAAKLFKFLNYGPQKNYFYFKLKFCHPRPNFFYFQFFCSIYNSKWQMLASIKSCTDRIGRCYAVEKCHHWGSIPVTDVQSLVRNHSSIQAPQIFCSKCLNIFRINF